MPFQISGTSGKYFARNQQWMVNSIGYLGLSRCHILRSKSGSYSIAPSSSREQCHFYIIVGNTLIKVLYIIYLLIWKSGEMEFLDKLTLGLYFLLFGIMSLSYTFWLRQYPFYEILHGFWKIEESIFYRLGSPKELKATVDKLQSTTVWIHLAITWVGCVCFLIQYCADPKYYTFMYAIVDGENTALWIVFGIHEFIFMQHCWSTMISCNCCFTFHAIILDNFLSSITQTTSRMCQQIDQSRWKSSPSDVIAAGTKYNINLLLKDYRHLMIITQQYNEFASYKTVFLHACGYCQFIADVFIGVQVLRIPGTTVLDIWFYIEDSLVSMYMIYRVYMFMSRVQITSKEFFKAVQLFLRFPNPERKRIQQVVKTLNLISLKLGPRHVTRNTVLAAMDILSNYYICVALWK